jgi:hypothetical protein
MSEPAENVALLVNAALITHMIGTIAKISTINAMR